MFLNFVNNFLFNCFKHIKIILSLDFSKPFELQGIMWIKHKFSNVNQRRNQTITCGSAEIVPFGTGGVQKFTYNLKARTNAQQCSNNCENANNVPNSKKTNKMKEND